MSPRQAETRTGNLVGLLGNLVNASTLAMATTYLLSATGRDKALLKGMGLAAIGWVVVDGVFMGAVRHTPNHNPRVPLYGLGDHLIFALASTVAITHLGHESLFPNDKTVNGRIPLISTDGQI